MLIDRIPDSRSQDLVGKTFKIPAEPVGANQPLIENGLAPSMMNYLQNALTAISTHSHLLATQRLCLKHLLKPDALAKWNGTETVNFGGEIFFTAWRNDGQPSRPGLLAAASSRAAGSGRPSRATRRCGESHIAMRAPAYAISF